MAKEDEALKNNMVKEVKALKNNTVKKTELQENMDRLGCLLSMLYFYQSF